MGCGYSDKQETSESGPALNDKGFEYIFLCIINL